MSEEIIDETPELDKYEDDKEDDYYSEENIKERKRLRALRFPKPKKPYYPPYEPHIKKKGRKKKKIKIVII